MKLLLLQTAFPAFKVRKAACYLAAILVISFAAFSSGNAIGRDPVAKPVPTQRIPKVDDSQKQLGIEVLRAVARDALERYVAHWFSHMKEPPPPSELIHGKGLNGDFWGDDERGAGLALEPDVAGSGRLREPLFGPEDAEFLKSRTAGKFKDASPYPVAVRSVIWSAGKKKLQINLGFGMTPATSYSFLYCATPDGTLAYQGILVMGCSSPGEAFIDEGVLAALFASQNPGRADGK